jgi:hypothetical protein
MTGRCDTLEMSVHAVASHECSSHVTGLSAVCTVNWPRPFGDRTGNEAAEARSSTDRDAGRFADIQTRAKSAA